MMATVEFNARRKASEQETFDVPRHVAIIMDGNGRWAADRRLPRTEGHRRGVQTVRDTVRCARSHGVEFLTIFSFSSENWSRPAGEVRFLMGLLKRFIREDLAELCKANVRVRVIGRRDNLSDDIARLLKEAEDVTASCTGLTLVIAFNYGARDELVRAVKVLTQKVSSGELAVEAINEAAITQELDTSGIPDPDLIIRTSGEQRLSNFLLWQAAYTEFYFAPMHWPDFDAGAFEEALCAYGERERRFGGLSAKAIS